MKGVIFQAYLEFIREAYGEAIHRKLASERPVLATHNYPDDDFFSVLKESARLTGDDEKHLMRGFGAYFTQHFAPKKYAMFYRHEDFSSFVHDVERIHDIVTRSMPGARPPHFTYEDIDERTFLMTYHSPRMLGNLVIGLLEGAARYFGNRVSIETVGSGKDEITYRISLKD